MEEEHDKLLINISNIRLYGYQCSDGCEVIVMALVLTIVQLPLKGLKNYWGKSQV